MVLGILVSTPPDAFLGVLCCVDGSTPQGEAFKDPKHSQGPPSSCSDLTGQREEGHRLSRVGLGPGWRAPVT